MNRDPAAWARLGRALRSDREHQKLTQEQLGGLAGVSARSVYEAEGGAVPKKRMPYSIGRIAAALGWPDGAVSALLQGKAPPGDDEWRDAPVDRAQLNEEQLAGIMANAMVRATERTTAAEIRAATKIALDELRRHGVIAETNGVQPSTNSGNA